MKSSRNGETPTHLRLKRLALIWAQQNGHSACATEVSLPRCRYRADVAAYRPVRKSSSSFSVAAAPSSPRDESVRLADRTGIVPACNSNPDAAETAATTTRLNIGTTAIFECKQCLVDLRRDNRCAATTTRRLDKVHARREILERNLRVHYPALRVHDSLFAEFDSHNFEAIDHRGYKHVLRQTRALQNRLFDCTKFETLIRYRCANLFFLVLPRELFREPEIPIGWGALIESNGALELVRKPVWHDAPDQDRLAFLERIARAGTRAANRQLGIAFEEVSALTFKSISSP
jgi:hypothetical protein